MQAAPASRKRSASIRNSATSAPTLKARLSASSGDAYACCVDGGLNGYQKKKYVCKLIYIHLLGWPVDFPIEAINLLSSNKYSEKQIVRTWFLENVPLTLRIS